MFATMDGWETFAIFQFARKVAARGMDIARNQVNVCAKWAGKAKNATSVFPTQDVTWRMAAVRSHGSATVTAAGSEHFAMKLALQVLQSNRDNIGFMATI